MQSSIVKMSMFRKTLLTILCLWLTAGVAAYALNYGDVDADKLPPSGFNNIVWQDPGGWTVVDVTAHGLPINTPSIDASAKVLDIVGSTTGRRILYFPEGTYYFNTDLTITSGDIRIKGEGSDKTMFLIDAPASQPTNIRFSGSISGSTLPVIGSLAAGISQITLSNASTINVGDFIRLYATDWVIDGTNNVVGQIFQVVDKSGHMLTLDMKLGIDIDASRAPVVQKLNMVNNVGVEDVNIHRVRDNADYSKNVEFTYVYNGRVINIESSYSANIHIGAGYSKQIVIDNNMIHDSYDYGGLGHGYGINLNNSTTSVRASNNKLWNLRHHIVAEKSANHSVFSYNSLEAAMSGSTNAIAVHGKYAHNNLFEGNWSSFHMVADGAHQDNGPGNTFFRNLGTQSIGNSCSCTDGTVTIGNVMKTLMNSGSNNYVGANRVNGVNKWGVFTSGSQIPASLYTSSKPDFLGARPWPIFGPGVGSDWGISNSLPAMERSRTAADDIWNLIHDDLSHYATNWGVIGSNGSVTQKSGHVTIVDGGLSPYYYMTKKDFTAPSAPFTFETRAKVNEAGTMNEFSIRSGSYLISLYLTHGTSGTAQNSESSPAKSITLDTTQYHDYRVVVHSDYTYDLYVDSTLAWSGAASLGSGSDILKIGGSNVYTANFDVDFFKMGSGEIMWNLIDDGLDNYTAGWGTIGTNGSVNQNTGSVTIIDGGLSPYYYMTKMGFSAPSAPFTFEARAKVNTPGTMNEFSIRSGSYLISLYLTHGASGTAQNSESSPAKSITLNTTQYHDYRVVVHSNYTYDLYVDGTLAWSGAASLGSGSDILKIGGSNVYTANFDVDRFRLGSGAILP